MFSILSRKKERITFDYTYWNEAQDYKIGVPILSGGEKFYPVLQKTKPIPICNFDYIKFGVLPPDNIERIFADYEIVEYFFSKDQAERWINQQPVIQKINQARGVKNDSV